MKVSILVVGERVGDALAPFHAWTEVPSYERECSCRRRPEPFTFAVEARAGCRSCKGAGTFAWEVSPIGRWDSWIAFSDVFVLVPGASPRRRRDDLSDLASFVPVSWSGLWPVDWAQARRRDLDLEATFDRPEPWSPWGLLEGGTLFQGDDLGWWPSVEATDPRVQFVRDGWDAFFRARVRGVPGDAVLTLVSIHVS